MTYFCWFCSKGKGFEGNLWPFIVGDLAPVHKTKLCNTTTTSKSSFGEFYNNAGE